MDRIQIALANKNDLSECANILREIYNNNVLNEGWTEKSSNAICEFYFKLQPDLFYVAKQIGGGGLSVSPLRLLSLGQRAINL